MINVHPSLLPRWRGAAPPSGRSWPATRRLFRSCGSPGLDSGAVCLPASRADPPRRRLRDARLRLQRLAESCWCERSTSGRRSPSRTSRRSHTRTRSRPPTPSTLGALLRARANRASLRPHIERHWRFDGDFLGVVAARVADAAAGPEPGRVRAASGRLLLGASGGALELTEIRPPSAPDGRRLASRSPARTPRRLRRPHAGLSGRAGRPDCSEKAAGSAATAASGAGAAAAAAGSGGRRGRRRRRGGGGGEEAEGAGRSRGRGRGAAAGAGAACASASA